MAIFFIFLSLFFPVISVQANVNLETGAFITQLEDLRLSGQIEDLVINRVYNSTSREKGIFGLGWSSDLEKRLISLKDALVIQEFGTGKKYYYKKDQFGNYVHETFKERTLVRDGKEYVLTIHASSEDRFNEKGQWIYHKNLKSGFYQKFSYKKGQLKTLESNNHLTLRFKWNKHFVTEISTSRGSKVTYNYLGDNLISFKGLDGKEYQYKYDAQGLLIEYNNERIHHLKLDYDSRYNVIRNVKWANGEIENYVYKFKLMKPLHFSVDYKKFKGKKVLNKESYQYKYRHEGERKFLEFFVQEKDGKREEYYYDKTGMNPIKIKKDGKGSSYKYNEFGKISEITDFDGTKYTIEYNNKLLPSKFSWKKFWIQYKYKNGQLAEALTSTDKRVFIEYDKNMRMTQVTDQLTKKSKPRTIYFQYDKKGRMKTVSYSKKEFVKSRFNKLNKVENTNEVNFDKKKANQIMNTLIEMAKPFDLDLGILP